MSRLHFRRKEKPSDGFDQVKNVKAVTRRVKFEGQTALQRRHLGIEIKKIVVGVCVLVWGG